MTLTLGNDLTGTVAREVSAASRKSSGLGESLTTGNDKFVEVVDGFLGSSLRDSEIVLGAIAKNTAYSINMLTITDEYLKTVATSLQEGLKTIGSAGPLSADKLAVLQKNLNDKRGQVDLLIKTADFDGKALLGGGAGAVEVQVGLSITDKLTLSVTDISDGKLLRSSVSELFNKDVIGANAGDYDYYTAPQIATDSQKDNFNLFYAALTGGNGVEGGSGTQDTRISDAHIGTIFARVRNALPADQQAQLSNFLNNALPLTLAAIKVGGANRDFSNVTNVQLAGAFGLNNNRGHVARSEFVSLFADNANTNLSYSVSAIAGGNGEIAPAGVTAANAQTAITALGVGAEALNNASRVRSQDVFTNALNSIRAEQASVSNQKQNVVEAADALRATTNVTQKAADSYLKTDYVMTAQQYSETIRTMVASITALQAANKIPEAAQRLIDALAR